MEAQPRDEDLVRETLADRERFALLVERYEARLARYLQRLGVGRREDREDLLQDTFIKAYRNLNSFDQSLSFSSWVYRITHNEAMSFFRRRTARPEVVLDAESESLLLDARDEGADPSAAAESRLNRAELARAFAALPEKYRDTLTLRFFEHRSYAEMSDIVRAPLGTVSTLVHRAKAALAAALAGRLSP